MERLELPAKVGIPKWDTDPGEAPLSWLFARIYVFFGYGLLPLPIFVIQMIRNADSILLDALAGLIR